MKTSVVNVFIVMIRCVIGDCVIVQINDIVVQFGARQSEIHKLHV